jgi:hypothetical protein
MYVYMNAFMYLYIYTNDSVLFAVTKNMSVEDMYTHDKKGICLYMFI